MTAEESSYEVLSSSPAYESERLAVRVDTLSMPDGSRAPREVVVVDDAVAVVAIDGQQRVCLLEQYRHPFGERVRELPAGKLDVRGEAPLAAAQRELAEEAELGSEEWTELTCFLNSAGWTTERTYVFLAERASASTDLASEFVAAGEEADLKVSMVALGECLEMIDKREIVDAKTIIGLLLATRKLGLVSPQS
jgi:8-oxo-dGTP pyrophosphatase MutT (NUDIX family)